VYSHQQSRPDCAPRSTNNDEAIALPGRASDDRGHALPERLHGRGETQVLGNRDADAAGGVYREQTTDERGAEQPSGHSRLYEIQIDS
jgi:hypothetical protein